MEKEALIKGNANEVVRLLQTDVTKGLSEKEAEERLKKFKVTKSYMKTSKTIPKVDIMNFPKRMKARYCCNYKDKS